MAKVIKGKIYALDIEPDMIRITDEEVKKHGLRNVQTVLHDFMIEGSGLPNESMDYVMLFNILHLEKPMFLINEDCIKWAESAGFKGTVRYDLKPYHYGIVLIKGEVTKRRLELSFQATIQKLLGTLYVMRTFVSGKKTRLKCS